MPASRPLLGKVLDLVVYAPVGLAAQIRSDVPSLVATGRTRVTERVQVARWVGEMAVTYGRRELERRLTTVSDDHHLLEPLVAVPLAAVAAHVPAAPPFDGYEQLAAAQIVQLLGRLPDADLLMIREYEAAHRARRTILAKLEQLLDG
jgi:hypothetical protein